MGIISISLLALVASAHPAGTENWTYDVPGGGAHGSPDYEVSLESGGKRIRSFVHTSSGLGHYDLYDFKGRPKEGKDFKKRSMDSHSAAIFSMDGSTTVRVTVKPGAKHITLPLTSARILPTSYHIPCQLEGGDTIVFHLDRPEKVVVVANYDQAWGVFQDRGKDHVPASSWKETYQDLSQQKSRHGQNLLGSLSEGYRNPLVILAHPAETDIPDKNVRGTLLVKPGDAPTQEEMEGYDTVWFAPGVHDLSQMGEEPWHHVTVRKGQTFYLEGGSYVMARFRKNKEKGSGPASIRGRGVISGIQHKWLLSFEKASQVIDIDNLSGVTITDRACFGIYGGTNIDDIAMLGAWHGNTDGPDYLDHCVIRNSFLMAQDDNLKINDHTRAKHLVIWQMENAHAIMVKEMRDRVAFSNSLVEDIDIIAYHKYPTPWPQPWGRLGPGAISMVTGTDLKIRNFTFRNIRIESPYLFRVFSIYNLDTGAAYAPEWFSAFPPTSEDRHTRIDGVQFEDITVSCPLFAYRSLLGSAYDRSLSNIRFVNLNINGTTVTERNKDEFFEIEYAKVNNLLFQGSSN